MVKGEVFRPTERIKLYVLEVKDTPKGPKVSCIPYPSGTGKTSV